MTFMKDVVGLASVVADVLKPLAPIWKLLRRLWRRKGGRRAGLPQLLCIVARHERWRYDSLRRAFANDSDAVDVILDRRRRERRRRAVLPRVDRRENERRTFNVDGRLLRSGWALAPARSD